MTSAQKSAVNVVFGAMTFGKEGICPIRPLLSSVTDYCFCQAPNSHAFTV